MDNAWTADNRADSDWLSATAAAERLGVSQRTIRRAVARGDLTATKHAGVYWIAPAELARYASDRRPAAFPSRPVRAEPPQLIPLPKRQVAPPAPLPQPLTRLIGRDRQVAEAADLVSRADVRLVTMTGPGGVGKTRLALQVAADLIERSTFADGVRFVPLAGVPDAGLVAASLAGALGIQETLGRPLRDALVIALRDTESLLLVDNFEHVLAATPLLIHLLAHCPRLRLLVTSRTLLRVTGEYAFPVSPLALPDAERGSSLEAVASSPAVQLFAERARAVSPAFSLTESTAPIVVDLCRRLDCLPLAIELAAARLTHLSLPTLRERLERRLPLLTGGSDRPDRHRTLRDAISWSYDLLSDEEQALLRRLAVFADGFTLDSVECLMGDLDADRSSPSAASVLDCLASLVDKSFVSLSTRHSGETSGNGTRYTMLETIREFAAEQLTANGEDEAARRAHAVCFLTFAEQHAVAPFLPDDGRGLAELAAEDANLQAALTWLTARGERSDFARLVAALGWYWMGRGHLEDGGAWFEQALTDSGSMPATIRARIALAFGLTLLMHGEHQRAGHWQQESLALARGVGDPLGTTQALIGLGAAATVEQEYDRATTLFEEALALAPSVHDSRLATTLASAAFANLGVAARGQGRLAAAGAAHEAALVGQREVGFVRAEAQSLLDLGDVALEQSDLARAFGSYREGMLLAWEHGETRVVVESLEGFACTAALSGQTVAATRLCAAAERQRERTGFTQRFPLDLARYERVVAAARAALGEADFATTWRGGRALSLAQAVAEALDSAAPTMPFTESLSPREIDVLRLLASGLPDREIAEPLFLSVRTVEGHVARIYPKLSVRTRAAAVRAAITAGLVPADAPVRPAPPR